MKKISYEEAKKRFEAQGRIDLELVEEKYVSWKENALFFDKVYNEYFISIPKNVYVQRSCHPKRALENRKQTNIDRYGNVCSLHGVDVKSKVKQTMFDKYGVEHAWHSTELRKKYEQSIKNLYGVDNISQADSIKAKKRKTTRSHYGVDYPAQNKEIFEKQKASTRNLYGVDHALQSIIFQEKVKQTLEEKYKVHSPFQLSGVNEKAQQTCIEKYGKPFYSQSKSKVIVDSQSNQTVIDWWKSLQYPKPSYSHVWNELKENKTVTQKNLTDILTRFSQHKTSLESFAESLFASSHYNQKAIKELPYKPDFKINENLFVNVDGLYWHSEVNKSKNHHFDLRKRFEEYNLKLIQFHEDEIKTKPEIVKSIVASKSGKIQEKIHARKTTLRLVSQPEAKVFLEKNHLMGNIAAKHIGLFDNNKLVCLLSYKTFTANNSCHIERFCSLCNVVVVGGFTKLLSALEKLVRVKEYMYWVDLRYGTGEHLLNHGFIWKKDTLGWKWTDGTNTYNRLRCRANMDNRKLSEKEHAEELGWERIYDAGQRLYCMSRKPTGSSCE